MIPGTAHLPNLEQPKKFNALLDAFLKDAAVGTLLAFPSPEPGMVGWGRWFRLAQPSLEQSNPPTPTLPQLGGGGRCGR